MGRKNILYFNLQFWQNKLQFSNGAYEYNLLINALV